MSKPDTEQNPESEYFGYQKVKPEDKSGMVHDVFASVAENYDIMNDFMSAGIHRPWKNRFVQMMRPRPEKKLLDVAGGTGDIAFRYLKEAGSGAEVTVCDINENMLRVGQDRAIDKGILNGVEWVTGNAESLPFPDESFDLYSISFGLRNVPKIDDALKEAYRVLKPGGRFFCLEFSHVTMPGLDKLYDLYSFNVIPKIGEIVAKDHDSYQYLVESIRQMPTQDALEQRILDAGFNRAHYQNLMTGIAAIHTGWKD